MTRHTYETFDGEEGLPARRLKPPARLVGRVRVVFAQTVANCAAEQFKPSDSPLLERYAEVVVFAETAFAKLSEQGAVIGEKISPWFWVHASAVKTLNALALRLRLSPQSRSQRAPKTVATPSSYYDTMELEEEGSDDDDGFKPS
jgi:phage terminase small subunit